MAQNVVDNTNYGFTEGVTKAEAMTLPLTAKNTGVINANNCTSAGVYVSHVSGSNSNLPSASSYGTLIVLVGDDLSSSDITQLFFDSTDHKIYTRFKNSSIWSSWVAFGA